MRTLSGVMMRFRSRVFLTSFISALVLSTSVSGQGATAGTVDRSGRILTKIVVTMNEPGAYGRPAAGLAFLVVAEDGDRVSVKTDEAGVASAWLAPGSYRFVTPDPLDWEGYAYTWDRVIPIPTRGNIIQLTQDDARSIALGKSTPAVVSRTSEPAALSSQPTPWKASVPPTEDLRGSPATTSTRPLATESTQPKMTAVAQQNHHQRKGLWFNVGTGYGVATCDACSVYYNGYSGGLSLGGTISPRFLLGVGTTSWYRYENGASMTAGTVDARIRFYPSATGGFFLTGGIGAGMVGETWTGYGSAAEFGLGSVLGIGWDIPIANSASLTPFWNGFGVLTSNANASAGQIGVGFTFHQ